MTKRETDRENKMQIEKNTSFNFTKNFIESFSKFHSEQQKL